MAEPLALGASIIAVLQLTGSVITLCSNYRAAAKGATWDLPQVKAELGSLRDMLNDLKPRTQQVEIIPTASTASNVALLHAPLENCQEMIKWLEAKLKSAKWINGLGRKGKAAVQALSWPVKEAETKRVLDSIGRFKATLTLALSIDQKQLSLSIHNIALESQQDIRSISRTTRVIHEDSDQTKLVTSAIQSQFEERQWDKLKHDVCIWLKAPDPSTNYNSARKSRQPHTGLWFVEGRIFARWKRETPLLWLYGKPGCGKSVLSSTIIENITTKEQSGPSTVTAYFFFTFNDIEKQHPEKMIRSLITQLFTQRIDTCQALCDLYSDCNKGKSKPDISGLMKALKSLIEDADVVYIVLDALDECSETSELLETVREIREWNIPQLHMLLTSRNYNTIEEEIEKHTSVEDRISLQSVLVDVDIAKYVNERLQNDRAFRGWRNRPDLREEIQRTLIQKVDGM